MKQFKGYMHGVNLGGWLSQCVHTKEHYDSFINEMDIRKIKSWGMDHPCTGGLRSGRRSRRYL